MKAYNFNKVNLIINSEFGQFYVTGFKDGTNITAERETDKYTIHKGAKGDVSFAATNDKSGTIQFTIKADSTKVNRELEKIADNDIECAAEIVDANDTTKSNVNGTHCVIKKPSKYERGAELTDSEWTIWAGQLDFNY